MEDNDRESLTELFQRAIEKKVDERLSLALTGEKEWPLLDDYIDRRIEAYLAQRRDE